MMHGLGHPGVERTRQTIAEKFVWPSLRADVTKWSRECQHCQRAKVLRQVAPPIGDFEVPNKRFEHLNLDLVTFTPSNSYRYLLTIVDRFSRWPTYVRQLAKAGRIKEDKSAKGLERSLIFGILKPNEMTK